MEIKNNAAQVIGWIFIIVGIISAVLIAASFDYDYYNYVKDSPITEDQLDFLESELLTTWVYAIVLLIGNVAIGVVIMTLGKILGYVQLIATGNKAEVKSSDLLEKTGN